MFRSRRRNAALLALLWGMGSCALAPEQVEWKPIGTLEGTLNLPDEDADWVALSWILSVRGVDNTTVVEVPFAARRQLVVVSRPDGPSGGQIRLPIVEPPPDEAFLPVAPDGVVELGAAVGEIAFGSLAVVSAEGGPAGFQWTDVDDERADLVMEVRNFLVVWWDGGPMADEEEWYSLLRPGLNLVTVTSVDPDLHEGAHFDVEVVPFDAPLIIDRDEEEVGYDACGNTNVEQVAIDATRSDYTYPDEHAYAWCSLFGTTLTHLVCEEIADALCVSCRVEVTTFNYGAEIFEEMDWYCDDVLENAVDTECDAEDFAGDDFPEEPRQCVRGELYACVDGVVEYLGESGCADCSEECDSREVGGR